MVSAFKKYRIDIFNLSPGEHEFEFEFDNEFFESFEKSLIETGSGTVKITLNKSEAFLDLLFTIDGVMELTCDRSLDLFDYPLNVSRKLMIKFGDKQDEISDELIYMPWDTQSIDVTHFIYEFIGLEIPMKKLHPRYENDDDENEGDELIYSSLNSGRQNDSIAEKEIDPRWKRLEEIKTNISKKENKE